MSHIKEASVFLYFGFLSPQGSALGKNTKALQLQEAPQTIQVQLLILGNGFSSPGVSRGGAQGHSTTSNLKEWHTPHETPLFNPSTFSTLSLSFLCQVLNKIPIHLTSFQMALCSNNVLVFGILMLQYLHILNREDAPHDVLEFKYRCHIPATMHLGSGTHPFVVGAGFPN